jgi:nicotinate-nucleotide adenylyltransferase
MRLGIFGGTFDPPHLGHMILAMECRWQLELDRVLWVLTPNPPHKNGQYITPLDIRLRMLQTALHYAPEFELSRVDIDRPAPHYALDTVLTLRELNPADQLIYLMGADSLEDLPNWHRPPEFLSACDRIGVMRRPGESDDLTSLEQALPGIAEKVEFVRAPLLEISATEIRQRAMQGVPFRFYLLPDVYRLIETEGIYQGDLKPDPSR